MLINILLADRFRCGLKLFLIVYCYSLAQLALPCCFFWHLIQERFVSVIQTNLSSSLQLIIRSKSPPLKFAHSHGFLIRQLISSFARFAVVNSSCLLCKNREHGSHLATLSASRTHAKLSGPVQCLRTMIYLSTQITSALKQETDFRRFYLTYISLCRTS